MAFVRQNYQMLGWMFFPVALCFTSNGDYALSSLAWYLTGLGGITQIFFGFPLSVILLLLIQIHFYS